MKPCFVLMLFCSLTITRCSGSETESEGLKPAMEMNIEQSGSTSVTLGVKYVNASHIRLMCVNTDAASRETAQSVAAKGAKHTAARIIVDGLTPLTNYTLLAVACSDKGACSDLQIIKFATEDTTSEMYAWEKTRNGILSYSDMILCYGGSPHRTPYRWDKARFAPLVSYTNEKGSEQWLFDAFLCIEFQSSNRSDGQNYAYMVGLMKDYGFSAGKAQWQELIDYWFDSDNGVNALEAAVKEASLRLGTPPSKRKVVITMPDPIIYKVYDGKGNGSGNPKATVYWGELNGRKLDFGVAQDRIDAYKWYINEVRKRFNQKSYQYVELAGFYIISEELASPDDGWNYELKRSDEVVPYVAAYLHTLNESLNWIPYNRAAGYTRWKKFRVDYAYMQPNHFWDNAGEKPLSRFFADIKANNLAMEFEFDEALLEGKANSDTYKARFRAYMTGAKQNDIYGSQPLSYYHGTNGFYELWKSTAEKDKALYHEFCQFVIGNPLRK